MTRHAATIPPCPASTDGVRVATPDAASFALPSNLGASRRCDALFLMGFCMFALISVHPLITALFVVVVGLCLAAAVVDDGHWRQPDVE